MPLGPTPSLNVHTHTIMEQDAVCRTQNGGRHMLGFVFDNVGVVLHTTYARRSQLHNAGLLVLILSNHEAEFGGPATTQGSLTQGNKLRESKDQLHEAIGR